MKIFEITNNNTAQPSYNVANDLLVFMRNNTAVYRKTLFPVIATVSKQIAHGRAVDPISTFRPAVDLAIPEYCKEFNIPIRAFTKKVCDTAAETLAQEEIQNIKQGKYK
jgi:hypothetical protein